MIQIIKRYKEELIICLLFLVYAFGFNVYRIQSDGIYQYAFLEQMLRIPNPESLPAVLEIAQYFKQRGCCFLNAPFYLLAYAIETITRWSPNFQGITLRSIAINIASNFYMALSLVLVVRTLKRLDCKRIVLPVMSALISAGALAAAVLQPSMTHTADIFVMSLIVYLFIRVTKGEERLFFWIGALCVFAILVRYFNFVLIPFFVVYCLCIRDFKKLKFLLSGLIAFAWIIPFLLYVYNGTISPFYGLGVAKTITDTNTIVLPLYPKYSIKILVHPLHGIFVWEPVTLLAVLSFLFPVRKKKLLYGLCGIWASYIFIYGYINTWTAGWSFGNRYLVHLFPVYAIGLALFCEKYKRVAVWLIMVATIYSSILFLHWHLCIMNAEYGIPIDIVRAWQEGYSQYFLDKTVDIQTVCTRLWEMCRYKYIVKLFL